MSPDTIKYFEGLLSIYTDNIRISDIKSNIILFFLTVSIPTVVAFRAQLPVYVPLLLLLLLPLSAIILLILAIYPRFVVTPGFPFFVKRSARPRGFCDAAGRRGRAPRLVSQPLRRTRKILYWKIVLFRTAMAACLIYLAILFALSIGGALHPAPT